jgi:hypothetical protein
MLEEGRDRLELITRREREEEGGRRKGKFYLFLLDKYVISLTIWCRLT